MQQLYKYDFINYICLAFINGISDAISVLLLHKLFVVLMSGNIIFLFINLAVKLDFIDLIRAILLITFIINNMLIQKYFIKLNLTVKLIIVILVTITYCTLGEFAYINNYLNEPTYWVMYLSMLASISNLLINNVFYQVNATRYNLIVYTMNLVNFARFLADRDYIEVAKIFITITSFALGVYGGATFSSHYHFFTILLTLLVLLAMYYNHAKYIIEYN